MLANSVCSFLHQAFSVSFIRAKLSVTKSSQLEQLLNVFSNICHIMAMFYLTPNTVVSMFVTINTQKYSKSNSLKVSKEVIRSVRARSYSVLLSALIQRPYKPGYFKILIFVFCGVS